MWILAGLIGLLGGAGFMYWFDPQQGNRRRSLVRDQLTKFQRRTENRLDATSEDMRNRAQGIVAEAQSHLKGEPVPDSILDQRIRSMMGRFVSHPGAIDVSVVEGNVRLSGVILSREVQPFVAAVKRMQGVNTVDNRLQMRDSAEGIPDLQGGKTRPAMR